jgi:pimeloyl-ACP methyl ester carboxylesterase
MSAGSERVGVVLVHGGYHGAWCWDRLVPLLGSSTLAVDLPGRGSHPMNLDDVTVEVSAESVVADIDAAGFDRVVLVGHSLAGVTLPAIAHRLGDRALRLVFVSCLVVPDGQSVLTMTPAEQRPAVDQRLRSGPGGVTTLSADHHRELLGNDLDEEQWSYVLAHVGSDSMHFFTDTVRWSAEVESLPKTYVRLLQDRAVPGPDQDEMIRRLGPGVTEEAIDAGHEVMITRPAELAAIVTRIVMAADRGLGGAPGAH